MNPLEQVCDECLDKAKEDVGQLKLDTEPVFGLNDNTYRDA